MDLLRILIVYMAMLSSQAGSGEAVLPTQQPVPTATATVQVTAVPTAVPTPTPAPTAIPTHYTSLSEGSRGDKVKALQQALIDLGYLNSRADGAFGTVTRDAVIAFQKANGLIADGIAGSATQWLLYEGNPVRASEATPTPAPAQPAEELTPAEVRIVYQDQFGNIFNESKLRITRSVVVKVDPNFVPDGYELTGENHIQVLYTQGKAYPAVVVFEFHSPHIPAAIEVPVYYVTFDHGEREILYQSTVTVNTGSYVTVTADSALVPGYRLKSARKITVAANEEATIAPACAEFVFTAE